jgi:hypothetical protein
VHIVQILLKNTISSACDENVKIHSELKVQPTRHVTSPSLSTVPVSGYHTLIEQIEPDQRHAEGQKGLRPYIK